MMSDMFMSIVNMFMFDFKCVYVIRTHILFYIFGVCFDETPLIWLGISKSKNLAISIGGRNWVDIIYH